MDKKKTVIICLIIAAFFLYLVAAQVADLVFEVLHFSVNRDFVLTVPELLGVVVAVAVFFWVYKTESAMEFLMEATGELMKVVYPTPKESGQSAIVVIIMVAVATLLLAVFDTVWSSLTRFVLSVGS